MKPRRVLYVTRQLNYGMANVLYQLAINVDKNRYEPVIVFETSEQSDIRKKLTKSRIETIDLKKACDDSENPFRKAGPKLGISEFLASRFSQRVADGYLALKSTFTFFFQQAPRVRPFLKIIRDYRIDLIHTHSNLRHAKAEIMAAWISGIPCIAHTHAYYEPTYIEKIISNIVDVFIYISGHVAEHFYEKGFSRAKGKIIHNGIDLNSYPQNTPTNNIRNEFNINSDDILVGLIGRIDWWKGHEYFIEAFAEAGNKILKLRGMIIGDSSGGDLNQRYFEKLKKMITSFKLDEKIIFAGFRNDIPKIISEMDIVVHASSQPEPFGLVVIEGMAAGKPVVATAAGGVLDIIQDGVNGLLVPCKDSNAMAKAIIGLATDKRKTEILGKASRQRIVDKFTIEHQARNIEQLYDSIFGQS